MRIRPSTNPIILFRQTYRILFFLLFFFAPVWVLNSFLDIQEVWTISIGAFFLIWISIWAGSILTLKNTIYDLKEDRLEFKDTLLVRSNKMISWNKVTDVTLHETIVDRLTGVSTIYIDTNNASVGHDVVMHYIKNGPEVQEKIFQLMKNSN